MARQTEIEKVFQKFVDNTLTKAEYNVLMEYIKDSKYERKWEEMLDGHLFGTKNSTNLEEKKTNDRTKALYDKVIAQLEHQDNMGTSPSQRFPKNKIRRGVFYKVAASIIVIVGLFFGYQNGFLSYDEEIPTVVNTIDPNAIILKQGNGNVKVVRENDQQNIVDAKGNIIGSQKGNLLNYKTDKGSTLEELVYNELTVPYGKRFDLVLSDGTHVKLNAGTSLKYPVQFINGKKRKVYLKGEAYFDVAKDEAHPFVVNANEVNVQVLGTEFNISFYPEDSNINTVLVEGSINLYEENKENDQNEIIPLTPGHMASWNRTKKEMSVKKVDIDLYTAWKDGILLFRGTPFNSIRKKLERHFDISIENQNHFLEDQVYTASFMEESIDEILDAFKEDTPFSYKMGNDKIILLNTD